YFRELCDGRCVDEVESGATRVRVEPRCVDDDGAPHPLCEGVGGACDGLLQLECVDGHAIQTTYREDVCVPPEGEHDGVTSSFCALEDTPDPECPAHGTCWIITGDGTRRNCRSGYRVRASEQGDDSRFPACP